MNKIIRKISLQEKYFFDQTVDKNLQFIVKLMKENKLENVYPRELNDHCEDVNMLWHFRRKLRIRGDHFFF